MQIKRLIGIAVLSFIFNFTCAQTQWTKYAGNPVLLKGPSLWDIIAIGQPACLFENDTIKMWYVGVANDMKARICYAFSLDGINWTKHNGGIPVLDVGGAGEWDRGWLDAPEIVKGPGGYMLFYYGDTVQQSAEISSAYGLATSQDGINWTKYTGNPVFTKGNPGDWDGKWVESPAIVYDSSDSLYKMWYNGVSFANWLIKIGYATSPDGINWTKYGNNPVLDVGPGGSFDDMWVSVPAVLKRNNIYELWYSAFSSVSGFDTVRIGYAISNDGINWTKSSANPLFSTFTAPYDSLIDDSGPWAPDVIFDADSAQYKMWYEAEGGFLLATSPDMTVGNGNVVPFDQQAVAVFPNPAKGKFQIQVDTIQYTIDKEYVIDIYDLKGNRVFSSTNNNSKTTIILSMEDGIYILRIWNKNYCLFKRIIMQ